MNFEKRVTIGSVAVVVGLIDLEMFHKKVIETVMTWICRRGGARPNFVVFRFDTERLEYA